MTDTPDITILVPVFQAEKEVEPFLACISALRFPAERTELILVDNGSTDRTLDLLNDAQGKVPQRVKVLQETGIQGSYAARNKGLAHASAPLIAFTDIDCRPEPDWLSAGVARFGDPSVQAVGGQVRFTFRRDCPNGAEWVDAQTNMQMERNIQERGVAKTANLFVRKSVFDEMGLFRETLKSGGDVEWTGRATAGGHLLVYEPEAVVLHPARSYVELFRKQVRVGRGKATLSHAASGSEGTRPSSVQTAKELLRGVPPGRAPMVLFAVFLVALATAVGKLQAAFSPKT